MIEKIKEIFTGNTYPSGRLVSLMKKNPDVIAYCEQILKQTPEYEKTSYVIICIVKGLELPKCKACGNFIKYRSAFIQNAKYCNPKCKSADPDWIEKCKHKVITEETLLKRKATCLAKYRSRKRKSK